MKKLYNEPKVRIENPADVVTTSPEVETGRVPFPADYTETYTRMSYMSDSLEEGYNTQGN